MCLVATAEDLLESNDYYRVTVYCKFWKKQRDSRADKALSHSWSPFERQIKQTAVRASPVATFSFR